MAASGRHVGRGTTVTAAAAFVGALVATYNYLSPASGIDGTGGALLVIVTSLVIAAPALLLGRAARGRKLLAGLCLVMLLGTAFAAWLLNSPALVALMTIAAVGWLLSVAAPRVAAQDATPGDLCDTQGVP